jgi:hypothetical protein
MVDGTEFLDGAVISWFLATKLFSQITLDIGLEDESKLYSTYLVAGEADDLKVLLFVLLIQFLETWLMRNLKLHQYNSQRRRCLFTGILRRETTKFRVF